MRLLIPDLFNISILLAKYERTRLLLIEKYKFVDVQSVLRHQFCRQLPRFWIATINARRTITVSHNPLRLRP